MEEDNNAPQEISSKKRVGVYRQVVKNNKKVGYCQFITV